MKIITWNCNMAFRNKAELILQYKPDIVIIPECEHPDKLLFPANIKQPKDILWFGKNRNKGLAIISYSRYRFTVLPEHNQNLQMIIPIAVKGGDVDFNLFAVWANNPGDPEGQYVEQVWKAVHHYDKLISGCNAMLVGDFNSNTIWDRKYREGNHSNVVSHLETKGIFSSYHSYYKQKQGTEKHPTLYMYRHKDKPYHIDYCFMSAGMMKKLKSVEVGEYKSWAAYSDHVPVIVTLRKTRMEKSKN